MRGTPAEVFSHAEELRAMNLDVPQATAFAAELQAGGFALPDGLLTLEELADAIAQAGAGTAPVGSPKTTSPNSPTSPGATNLAAAPNPPEVSRGL
jgi:hypothetical protein